MLAQILSYPFSCPQSETRKTDRQSSSLAVSATAAVIRRILLSLLNVPLFFLLVQCRRVSTTFCRLVAWALFATLWHEPLATTAECWGRHCKCSVCCSHSEKVCAVWLEAKCLLLRQRRRQTSCLRLENATSKLKGLQLCITAEREGEGCPWHIAQHQPSTT